MTERKPLRVLPENMEKERQIAIHSDNNLSTRKLLVTNIQRFSFHDGPGIRTTVFLKGCSLRCPWCSNPENMDPEPQVYDNNGIKGVYGRHYSAVELLHECLKDRRYYTGQLHQPGAWSVSDASEIELLPGGVTFSGGEPLLQMRNLVPVCEELHRKNIHIAVETCLFVPPEDVSIALKHIDFFYIDVKILDKERCRQTEKGNLDLYLRNLEVFYEWKNHNNQGKSCVIRIPVIGGMTDDQLSRKLVYRLLQQYRERILKVELIKEHNLGERKNNSLNRSYYFQGVEEQILEEYRKELIELDIPVEICKIG